MSKHYAAEVHECIVNGTEIRRTVEEFPAFNDKRSKIEEAFSYYFNLPEDLREDFETDYQKIQRCIENYKNNAKLCFSNEHLDIHLSKIMEAVEKFYNEMQEEHSALQEWWKFLTRREKLLVIEWGVFLLHNFLAFFFKVC